MAKKKAISWKAPEGYLTREQTMQKLGVSGSTLRRIVVEGNFTEDGESIKFRKKRCYLSTAVDKYLNDQIKACSACK
jgi:hypothetical protein